MLNNDLCGAPIDWGRRIWCGYIITKGWDRQRWHIDVKSNSDQMPETFGWKIKFGVPHHK